MVNATHGSLMRVLCPVALGLQSKFGSIEEQTFWIARAFQRQGGLFLPLFMYPLGSQGIAEYNAAGIQGEHLDLNHRSITTLSRLIRLIYRHRIRVIHWNFYDPLNWYYLALIMLTPGVKHYLTDHGSRVLPIKQPSGVKKLVKKVVFRGYRRVFGNSDFVVECLKRQGIWNNLSRWRYLINTQRFSPDAETRARVRKELEADKQFVVLVVAQLIPEKGVDVALKALIELPAHVVLWVVGDGEECGYLQNLCKELSVEGRVRFMGLQRTVASYMQAADCLVCPSIWAEAVGLVILEALSCGLPVVASDIGGIPEYVDDGKNGFLFPAGDAKQLADRLRRLESDPEASRRMALAARSTALRTFSLEKRIDEYIDLYRA